METKDQLPQIGQFVTLNNGAVVVVDEQIDATSFWGIDGDGGEHEFTLNQILAINP